MVQEVDQTDISGWGEVLSTVLIMHHIYWGVFKTCFKSLPPSPPHPPVTWKVDQNFAKRAGSGLYISLSIKKQVDLSYSSHLKEMSPISILIIRAN